jgi:tripartite-type tricarboxylate transporter receptor subunit TctC
MFCVLAAALAAIAAPVGAQAETYPTRVIKVINPFAAGGFGDVVLRPMMDRLSAVLGQPVVIESHAGANGVIATTLVAKAAPDGYTLLLSNLGPIALNPALQKDIPYDPVKDFEPITQLVSGPLVLLVRPGLPTPSLAELIAYAKAHPGKLSYGSVGPGSTTHFAGELLNQKAGTEIVHVPYKGAAPVMADLSGEHVDFGFINVSLALPQIETGRLRGLAVTTLKRASSLPDLPAMAELLPGFEVNPWFGLMAPARTPREIVDRLHAEITKILALPETVARLKQSGLEPEGSTPAEYAARIKADVAQWQAVVAASGFTLD